MATHDATAARVSSVVTAPAKPAPSRRLRKMLALSDFEGAARRHLPRPIFGYIAGAAETNAAYDDNLAAFTEWGFLPQVMTNTAHRSSATTLLGQTWAAPFGIPPMGLAAIAAYRGDIALARAAQAANIPMVLSGTSLTRLEDVIREAPNTWFQAYLPGEQARIDALVDRVAAAGYRTLVVTVDTSVVANRENNVRNGFSTPLRPSLRLAWDGMIRPEWTLLTLLRTLKNHGMPHFENSYATRGVPVIARNVERDFSMRDHLDWSNLRGIRKRWQGHLIVKGLIRPDDARIAREEGADAVIASNHGGRQLDCTVSPLRTLPAMVRAAGPMPVMLDSGVRRGSDVLKAIALGASFVFVGRPFLYAAAIGGEPGVSHAIDILKSEVHRNMGLLGITQLSEMTMDRLLRVKPAAA